ncbi:GntR family transcriptional regulator [Halalkalibacillus halophilus]|uniref:GntR family transcriptional regulator n=1 Tax=Halalkalibacillus halophilus TaxID=392827 RepID=UPI0003F72372|nr:GntR family transcriptional regulator [Halalkalibacillus halophilus]
MNHTFDNDRPIFIQIRDRIEDQIVNNQLLEEEQAPSTNQLVNFYNINHVTAAKGINQLVDEGILYKKRGIGTFVNKGAKSNLINKRKRAFVDDYITPMVQEANHLEFTEAELIDLIKHTQRSDAK